MIQNLLDTKEKIYIETLIQKFTPLINKYSKKLNYDGAYTDLLIKFIEVIKNISENKELMANERIFLSYIKKSIENHYINLSKKNSDLNKNEILEDQDIEYDNFMFKCDDTSYSKLELKELLMILNIKERFIIINYLRGYKISEIATFMGVSRQAINKTKIRAFSKLKNYILYEK